MLLTGDGDECVLSLRAREDHPPLGRGEGVRERDIGEGPVGVPRDGKGRAKESAERVAERDC